MTDDMTDCPYCGEEIRASATRCRHCQGDIKAHGKLSFWQVFQNTFGCLTLLLILFFVWVFVWA